MKDYVGPFRLARYSLSKSQSSFKRLRCLRYTSRSTRFEQRKPRIERLTGDEIRENELGIVLLWKTRGFLFHRLTPSLHSEASQVLFEALPKSFQRKNQPKWKDLAREKYIDEYERHQRNKSLQWVIKAFDRYVSIFLEQEKFEDPSAEKSARLQLERARAEWTSRIASSNSDPDSWASDFRVREDAIEFMLQQQDPEKWPWVRTKNYLLESDIEREFLPVKRKLELLGFDVKRPDKIECDHLGKKIGFDGVFCYEPGSEASLSKVLQSIQLLSMEDAAPQRLGFNPTSSCHRSPDIHLSVGLNSTESKIAQNAGFVPILAWRRPTDRHNWRSKDNAGNIHPIDRFRSWAPLVSKIPSSLGMTTIVLLIQLMKWRTTKQQLINAMSTAESTLRSEKSSSVSDRDQKGTGAMHLDTTERSQTKDPV